MRKKRFFIGVFTFCCHFIFAQQNLLIRPSDLRLEPEMDFTVTEAKGFEEIRGYHLYIRKLPSLESVMLTETTKDPSGESANYAYRAMEYNSVNGDEIRYLDGKVLESEHSRFSLVDSTAEPDEQFGLAFHIYIPRTMQFGYPWARNGTLTIGRGTFMNIRAFSKKYADYTGIFLDNPYMFDLERKVQKKTRELKASMQSKKNSAPPSKSIAQNPEIDSVPYDVLEREIPVLTDDYNPVASAKFQEISETLVYSKGPDSIVDDIMDSLLALSPKEKVDVVFVVDATGSMKDDVEKLRSEWIPRLVNALGEFGDIRIGLLLYRDYVDSYRYRNIPVKFFDFTRDMNVFTKNLNGFTIRGNEGGDIPEAVYEGLYGALEFYAWNQDAVKKIILIGDAEPHPAPRGTGRYTKKLVEETARKKGISITAVITPDEKSRRGR